MLIAEDLFLLLTMDDGKAESSGTYGQYGYAAANIADLILAGKVRLGDGKDPRVSVLDPSPTGHPVLDAALARIADKDGTKISTLLQDSRVASSDLVARSLGDAGVITVGEKKMLGMIPATHPTLDEGPERATRDRLRHALRTGTVDAHDATLLSVLHGLGVAHKVLVAESGGLSRKELGTRIGEVSADVEVGSGVDRAVKSAVETMNAVIITTAMIPVITSVTT